MRSVGSEFLSAAITLSVPLGIVLSLPFGMFGFRAAEESLRPAGAAFVSLKPEVEQLAMRAARASWKENVGMSRRIRADLLCAELPEDERLSVLTVRDRSRPPAFPAVRCGRTPFLPSQKAPPPSPIVAEPVTESLTFPREELLKMN